MSPAGDKKERAVDASNRLPVRVLSKKPKVAAAAMWITPHHAPSGDCAETG
jgi:hypothetical protein